MGKLSKKEKAKEEKTYQLIQRGMARWSGGKSALDSSGLLVWGFTTRINTGASNYHVEAGTLL